MSWKTIILGFLLLGSLPVFSQWIEGTVRDSVTGNPLPFVNILLDGDAHRGITTDLDGHFEVRDPECHSLEFRYVGYAPKTVILSDSRSAIQVKLRLVGFQLGEVVIVAGENPAHRIIRKAVANRDLNDPMKYEAFSYEAYDKLYLTGERPEVSERISSPYVSDTIILPAFATVDSLMEDSVDMLDSIHLFLMETVSQRFYNGPGKDKTKVIANQVSGFKHPSVFILSSLLQPFSFYEDRIQLAGQEYLNPISPGSTSRYFFNIEDTIYQGADSVFMISFRPRKGKPIDGLRGVLYINTNQYALQYVLAEPADWSATRVRIQQQYEWIDGKAWFPTRLHADILMRYVAINNYYGLGIARSYIRNIELEPSIPEKTFNRFQLEVEKQGSKKPNSFWIQHRPDSLTIKEAQTYKIIDSIGAEHKFDLKLRWAMALLQGNLRTGPVEFPLERIIRYTGYEGFRVGLGMQTNENLTGLFTVGGYGAFSFADDGFKYGGFAKIHLSPASEVDLVATYHNDLFEEGRPQSFLREYRSWATGDVRHYLVKDMYQEKAWEVGITGRVLKYLYTKPYLKRMQLSHPNEYRLVTYRGNGVEATQDKFFFTEIGIQAKYAYRERLVNTSPRIVSLGTHYPIIWINYGKGVSMLDGEGEYSKLEGKITHTIGWLHLGETRWEIRGGVASGLLPYYKLFSPPGFRSEGAFYGILFNFNTMPIHGYLTDRYVSAGVVHNFGQLWKGHFFFNPEWKISMLGMVGGLNHPEDHLNVDIEPLNQPYLEAGFIWDRILRINLGGGVIPSGLGIGAFYRLGYYSTPKFSDNLAIRMTATF